jgi:hypothetical protein
MAFVVGGRYRLFLTSRFDTCWLYMNSFIINSINSRFSKKKNHHEINSMFVLNKHTKHSTYTTTKKKKERGNTRSC